MNLAGLGDVTTPLDDPCQYDPAWRSKVATYLVSEAGIRTEAEMSSIAESGSVTVTRTVTVTVTLQESDRKKTSKDISKKKTPKAKDKNELCESKRPVYPFDENPDYRVFAADKWIRMAVSLAANDIAGVKTVVEHIPLRLANRWYMEPDHEASMKKRLEALLLTEVGMDVITLDLDGRPAMQPAFEAYERMYFNCRDDDFGLHKSTQLVQRMAMPYGPLKTFLHKWEELDADGFVIGDGRPLATESDVWKAIAATRGYDALMYTWMWDRRAHGMKDRSVEHLIELSWEVAALRLFSDLYNGNIKHEDAARVLSAYTAQSKKISDDRNGSGGGEDGDVTKALMAVLYRAAPQMVKFDASETAAKNAEIQSRIQSQLAINKQAIEDRGKQVEAEIIDAQIADAVGK